MSSHHFVREDQEPALLIMDTHKGSFEEVQPLLEWSPTVLVGETVLSKVLTWGIKVDVVIGLLQNVESLKIALEDQFPVKILSCNTENEILSTALFYLIASKQKAVNILSELPLKYFETFASLDLNVFQAGKKWSYIRNGNFEKWLPFGRTLQIQSSILETTTIMSEGIVQIKRENGFWISED